MKLIPIFLQQPQNYIINIGFQKKKKNTSNSMWNRGMIINTNYWLRMIYVSVLKSMPFLWVWQENQVDHFSWQPFVFLSGAKLKLKKPNFFSPKKRRRRRKYPSFSLMPKKTKKYVSQVFHSCLNYSWDLCKRNSFVIMSQSSFSCNTKDVNFL